jgi:hypothetical protein
METNTRQKLLICFTYLIGKAGLLSQIDTAKCQLVFEAEESISAKQEVKLRKEYYKALTEEAVKKSVATSKLSYFKALDDATSRLKLEIANRQVVTIPLEGICSENGIQTIELLVENGYKCKKMLNETKMPCNKPFAIGKLKTASLFQKYDLTLSMCFTLKKMLGELSNFTVVASILLDKSFIDLLADSNEAKELPEGRKQIAG